MNSPVSNEQQAGAESAYPAEPLKNIMLLTQIYMAETPGDTTPTGHRLAMALGHFFMALMPRAGQNVVLTMTGFCMTQLALQRLQAEAETRKAARSRRKGA